jgi:DnaJ-domain-containing protein 1
MTDYFALLEEPRRPWLDEAVLKEKFISRSTSLHPDRVHSLGEQERSSAQERYVELNAAFNCLREPKARLRHLLELEMGSVPKEIQRIPSELMDLFMSVGQACREADLLITEKEKVTSPLLKVKFFEQAQAGIENLQNLQRSIQDRRAGLLESLKKADAEWTSAAREPEDRKNLCSHLEEMYRLFSYFDRWLSQIQERVVRLSF